MNLCFLDAETLGDDIKLTGLERYGKTSVYGLTSPEQVSARIQDQDIIITNNTVKLNENNLKSAERVKLICVAATGTDNVDLNYAKQRGIIVTNVPSYSTKSVAQHTFAMLFYVLESLSYYDQYVKSGQYSKDDTVNYITRPFWELGNKTWGIIGLGTIGSEVANIAQSFGCNIAYYSASGKNNNAKYTRLDMEPLLKESDIISIHAPLNSQTKGLIGYDQMKLMKRHAILLNLGRGGIVKEDDLARALDEELIAGAALDVTEIEPIPASSPLLSLKNKDRIIMTPHIAWASFESRQTLVKEVELNIQSFLNGTPRNVIN